MAATNTDATKKKQENKEDKKEEEEQEQSLEDILTGVVVISTLFLSIVASVLFLLIGSIRQPGTIGLFVALPYLTYTLALRRDELKDGSHWPAFSKHNFVLTTLRRYLRLTIQTPIPPELLSLDSKPNAKVMLAVFPHGAYSDYRVAMDGILDQAIPNLAENVRTLAASSMFRIPIVREIGLWTGCVDASRKVAERQLTKGKSILVLPGGEAEQIQSEHGKELVYVQKRKGFIKLSLRFATPVVPVYVFGTNDLYHTTNLGFGFRSALVKKLGVAIPLTAGKWGSPLCPINVKTTIVFGTPIDMTCKVPGEPTDTEVQDKHHEFVVALEKLFDDNKTALGYGDRKLVII